MHRQFRKWLDNATGTSEHIIAIVLDIRGFSSFCQKTDSFDVANYIKRIYTSFIDNYFSHASYYKPTGDGLLVVIKCPSKSLEEIITAQIQKCLDLLGEFENMCKDDPMIYFETPNKIGIGISRGSASRISSDSKTLDYSGRVINLASRLMDLARPSGIIFDASLGFSLLSKEIQNQFLTENIYVRGIAEQKPITVYYTKQHTIIPPFCKEPLKEPKWRTEEQKWLFKDISALNVKYVSIELETMPLDPEQILIDIFYFTKNMRIGYRLYIGDKGIHYKKIGDKSYIYVEAKELKDNLQKDNLTDNEIITFSVTYPVQ